MISLCDKIILYLFSFIYLFYLGITAQTVVLFLLSVASTCLLNAYTYDKHKIWFSIILLFNLILACTVPMHILFLPIILYDCLSQIPKYISMIFLIPIANLWVKQRLSASATTEFHTDTDTLTFLIILFAMQAVVSYALSQKTQKILKDKKDIIRLQDTYNEHKISLEHEYQYLLKQQDNEINIATLNERNRIAREIHDNIGHMLSRSILQVGALIAVNKDDTLNEPYQSLKESLNQAMDSIRNSVHDLHNDSIDLENNIQQLINSFDFCDVKLDYDISNYVSKEIKYCFITITKEALNNTIKHSNATMVTISIIEHPSFYKYVYDDNGDDKNTANIISKETLEEYTYREGIGLNNMRERVKSLHGIINFHTDNGFSIHITIPKS